MTALLLPLLLAISCGPKEPPATAAAAILGQGPPAVAAASTWTPPVLQVSTLSNGMPLWFLQEPGLPLVSLRVVVPGGKSRDPLAIPGLTSMADTLLTHGAGERDAQAFAAAMDTLAISLSASTGATSTVISLDGHADRLLPALDLLADALLRPRFDADELTRAIELRRSELQAALDEPRTIASWVGDRVWYGDGHPLSRPTDGTEEALAALTVDQVRQSWAQRRAAGTPTLVVVGDVDAAGLTAALEARLGEWSGAAAPAVVPPAPPARGSAPALYMVDNPDASQTMLWITMPGPALNTPGVEAARLGTIVLGGTFTSRLNRKLREEKGYTYGARAALLSAPESGRVLVSTAVQREVTAPALVDLLAELRRLPTDLAADEVEKARGSRRTDLVEMAGSRAGLAEAAADLVIQGRPPDAYGQAMAEAEKADVPAVLAGLQATRIEQAAVVVVGDLKSIRSAVTEAMPGDWVELDRLGAPVPSTPSAKP